MRVLEQQDPSCSNNVLNLVLDFPKFVISQNSNPKTKKTTITTVKDPKVTVQVIQMQDNIDPDGSRHSIR
eukprot:snap_masked-scaffold_45-processed-gene-1.96-mRNA-1 protein AED:1.00 eAED:1.00 QI:0/-1/0/0/-1/1/1/0/69